MKEKDQLQRITSNESGKIAYPSMFPGEHKNNLKTGCGVVVTQSSAEESSRLVNKR